MHDKIPTGNYCYAYLPAPGSGFETMHELDAHLDSLPEGERHEATQKLRRMVVCPHWKRIGHGRVRCRLLGTVAVIIHPRSEHFAAIFYRKHPKARERDRGFLIGDAVKDCLENRYGDDFSLPGPDNPATGCRDGVDKLLETLRLYPGDARPGRDTCFLEFLPREFDGNGYWNPDSILLHEEALAAVYHRFKRAIPSFDLYENIRLTSAEATALAAALREVASRLHHAGTREEAAACLDQDFPLLEGRPAPTIPWRITRDTLAYTYMSLAEHLERRAAEGAPMWILGL